MFRPNDGKYYPLIGGKVQLTRDIILEKGTILSGSILTIKKYYNYDSSHEVLCVDDDSGEEVLLHPPIGFLGKILCAYKVLY